MNNPSFAHIFFSKAGLLFTILAVAGLAYLAPNWVSAPSLLIVVGGTFAAVLLQTSFADFRNAFSALRDTMSSTESEGSEPLSRIRHLVDIAHKAKTKGMIYLDNEAERSGDSFLKLALELAVDGHNETEIRRILLTESELAHEKASRSVEVFEACGAYSPSFGLIGTIVGLVQMLGSIGNGDAMGPAMGLALLTTLYGATLANLICFPLAGKMKRIVAQDLIVKRITIEAVVSMRKEETVMALEQRLKGFLPALAINAA
jgi:chemotaxis protein MotA